MAEPITVRGLLEIDIKEAIDIPDTDGLFKGETDAYVKVKLDGAKLAKTSVVKDSLNPVWNQKFYSLINHIGEILTIEVVDDDIGKNDCVGTAEMNFKEFVEDGGHYSGPTQLLLEGEERGQIDIEISYTPFSEEYATELRPKIPHCYFPQRENCHVTLYQDAEHSLQREHEPITTATGESYQPPGAWRDLYDSLIGATKFIYITGWSVFTDITLVRGDDADTRTLGEILTEKAEEGCAVYIMIWDEYDDLIPSLVGTHDTATAQYFEDTKVTVKRCARRSKNDGLGGGTFARLVYTHHQKSVICDAPPMSEEDERYRIVAYVGGLDVTNGRYDTPSHPIYSTLLDQHSADFYQNCVQVRAECGPRQPWHDIHSRVCGKVAQDVLRNFEERWAREDDGSCCLAVIDSEEYNLDEDLYEGEDRWTVQFLRSITNQSCQFSHFHRAAKLKTERSETIEDSIHTGYIHQIRRCNNYVYIENQYFLGSSHVWEGDDRPKKAVNLVAIELVRHIVDGITLGKHPCVYCVIPMYPEGVPSSAPVQEILYWQTCTMMMMYKSIAQIIEQQGLDTHPTDYLGFYCLGVRGDSQPEDLAEPETEIECHLREKNRFPIYVHSKMLITDDEYIIVGSANINQRSMSGRRDTEMAVGCFQPEFLCNTDLPNGDVAAFRKSLWVEHMGEMCDEFNEPGTLECMRKVNEIALSNWEKFVSEEESEEPMRGHLLAYPIRVDQDGTVNPVVGFENFPDTDGSVFGKNSFLLAEKLTT